jgi:hypothetical protein
MDHNDPDPQQPAQASQRSPERVRAILQRIIHLLARKLAEEFRSIRSTSGSSDHR